MRTWICSRFFKPTNIGNFLFAGLAMALLATSATASNLVLNGGFTTGDFTDWNNTQAAWFIGGVPADPGAPTDTVFAAGTACAVAACNDPVTGAWISQTLATVAGQPYTLEFFYDPGGSGGGTDDLTTELDVLWDGSPVTGGQIVNAPFNQWTEYRFDNLIASGSSTILEFTGRQDPGELALTDISVTVPEPAPWLPIGAGLGMGALGLVRRRRRQA
jgi:hypothetical protein